MTERRMYTNLRTANMQRVYDKLLSVKYPDVRCCGIVDGKLLTGVKSKHRTPHARMWRTLLRLRLRRMPKDKIMY